MDFALLDSLNWKSLQKFSGSRLTHSVPRNQALVPCGCPHAAHRMRPSFRELYFRCLGKHSKTETSFKMNFFPMKGKNSITSYCTVLTFKSEKNMMASQRNISFWSIGYMLFMDYDSEHKVDDSDDGWVLDSEWIWEESEIAMLTVEMWVSLSGFSCQTSASLLLAPILLGLGEATHSELLGTKRVKWAVTCWLNISRTSLTDTDVDST